MKIIVYFDLKDCLLSLMLVTKGHSFVPDEALTEYGRGCSGEEGGPEE